MATKTQLRGGIELAGQPFALYIPEDEIVERTDALAAQIVEDYDGKPLDFLHILKGAMFWGADLTRAVRRKDRHIQIAHHVMRYSSYGHGLTSSGIVRQHSEFDFETEGANFVVVDEVVDKGLTMSHLLKLLGYVDPEKPGSGPASVAVAALTDKEVTHNGDVTINYPGFRVPDVFLAGMGMDFGQQGREYPEIYQIVTPEGTLATGYEKPASIPPAFSTPV